MRCSLERSLQMTPDGLTLQEYQLGIVKPGAKASEGCLELTGACPIVLASQGTMYLWAMVSYLDIDISHIRGWCWIIAEAQLMDYVASRLNPAWLTVFNIQEPLLPWVSGCILLTHCDLLPMQTTEWSQKQRLRWLMQLFSWALYNLALLSALHPCGHKGWTHNQVSCCHAFEPCESLLLRCASTWVLGVLCTDH